MCLLLYTITNPIAGDVLEERLEQAILYLDAEYNEPKSDFSSDENESELDSISADSSVKNFSYTLVNDKIYYRENSRMYLEDVSGKKEERIKGLVKIHNAVKDIIDFQTDDYIRDSLGVYAYNQEIDSKIKHLNDVYDPFVKKYGFINLSANISAFKKDGAAPLLRSIEKQDKDDRNTFHKADIFFKPTIHKKEVPKAAFNAKDALVMCLNAKGKVDLSYMAYIYVKPESATGKATEEEIIDELGDRIFRDPQKIDRTNDFSGYVLADEYLSGYVKDKLAFAEFHANDDPSYKRNVIALLKVQPKPLEAHQIKYELNSAWIPLDVYEQFIFELCSTSKYATGAGGMELEYSEFTGNYHLSSKSIGNHSVITNSTYGTSRKNAYEIIEETLNMRNVKVLDPVTYTDPQTGEDKKRYVLNQNETILARAKQEEIKLKFQSWLFSDEERTDRLLDIYNSDFNNIVVREYNGEDLTFPDMSESIKLRTHQRDVIAHGLFSNGNLLMAHEVGAGKTYSAIALSYEMKRMGIVNKPLITVPNHLVNQWSAAYMELYPNANILVADKKDLQKENRKRFCARIAASEYDAIIMAHSSFELIGLSREYQLEAMKKEIVQITQTVDTMKREQGQKWSLKQMVMFQRNLQDKYDKLFNEDKKDAVVNFESLGVDCLVVDESHIYKNNFSYTKLTNVAGVGKSSSQRAMDMHQKAHYINKINDGKGVVYLTGTPISNSMSELYVIQKTLQPNELAKRRHLMFDAWASHFGKIKTSLEIKPEGGGYQMKSRFAQFHNIPELMNVFRLVANIKTAKDLDEVPVPKLVTGAMQIVKTPRTESQKYIYLEFLERADDIRLGTVDSSIDNFLKMTLEAKLASVDPRILNPNLPDDPDYKLNRCARNVAKIYHETSESRLTQVIFCDSGTPTKDGSFNFYDQTKKVLISEGVLPQEIAFIHDYETDLQKQELYEKMRSGEIRILMGSTAKCGTGMNIQNRLIALHNLDIPWKPSDLTQRNGRIIRQGNENEEVSIFNYITEDTFDSYLYQILEQKQRFISQIMNGDSTIREFEDIDETVLQYAEFKALAISDPKLKEKMEIENELSRLMILKSAYHNSLSGLKYKINKTYPTDIESEIKNIERLKKDIEIIKANKPTEFLMNVDGRVHNERARAAEHIGVLKRKLGIMAGEQVQIGTYAGFDISLIRELGHGVALRVKGEKTYHIPLGDSDLGIITRMENAVDAIPENLPKSEEKLKGLYLDLENAKLEVSKPFSEEEKLDELKKKKIELDLALEFKQGGDDVLESTEEDKEETSEASEDKKRTTLEQRIFNSIAPMLSEFIHGDRYYAKYKSEPFMDLVIEKISNDEYSIAHYYELNGDLMRDPEITFVIDTEHDEIYPTSFLQDNMGIFYHVEGASKSKVDDLKDFMCMWFKNINTQGYELFKEKSYSNEEEIER